MINWRIFHQAETASTNLDAHAGAPGDVFTAEYQSAGRGRLDHKWLSPRGANLLMSVVLPSGELDPAEVATIPLAVGLAVANAITRLSGKRAMLKWPNDVLLDGRKVSGILCELNGENIIAGIGVNVKPQNFPPEIAARACALGDFEIDRVRDVLLGELADVHARWMTNGFAALLDDIRAIDYLKGRTIAVRQTDDDGAPLIGIVSGILADGALEVDGSPVYAGEAHIISLGEIV